MLPYFQTLHLPSIGPVDSNSVSLGRVFSEILNVAKDMPAAILAHEVSQVGTETHVCCGAFLKIPLSDWNASEKEESFAIDQVLSQHLKTS